MSDSRFFTVESAAIPLPSSSHGRYKSKTPEGAGVKAARQLFRLAPKKRVIHFVLRETTRGSPAKEFHYVGTKHKLEKPRVIKRDGIEIVVKYEYTVHADK
jgi:hypothetical protein